MRGPAGHRHEAGTLRVGFIVGTQVEPTTRSIDKFIQLAIAGQVVGLAAAWVEDAFARAGIRFIPVIDIESAVTAIAWRPRSLTPLAGRLLTIAGEHRPHGAGPTS